MRFSSCMMLGALPVISLQAQHPVAAPALAPVTAFVNVSVVPMDRERVLHRQTVIVRDGRIVAFGRSSRVTIPQDARRIDGQGKYLMPGLADMHDHSLMPDSAGLFSRLAHGVTTVRDMHSGGTTSMAIDAREAIASGKLLGPRIYTAGDPSAPGMPHAHDSDVSQVVLDSLVASTVALGSAGHDFVKLYGWPSPAYDSVIVAARRAGLPVVGHVPGAVGIERVLRDRWASIEHLTGYFEYIAKIPVSDQEGDFQRAAWTAPDTFAWLQPNYVLDSSRLRAIAVATRRAKVWNCPTLVPFDAFRAAWNDPHNPETQRVRRAAADTAAAPALRDRARIAQRMLRWIDFTPQFVKALHDAGAGLLLGTDKPGGAAVHRELELLVRAGLSPYEALVTGTRNVAQFLGTLDSAGTVAVGKRADLILLDGNPLVDIRYTAELAGVMINGRWLDRETIGGGAATVFTDVTVVPMDRPRARATTHEHERGYTLDNQTVVVRGRRIIAVGPAEHVTVPVEATIIEGHGKVLLPGLADLHAHLPGAHDSVGHPPSPADSIAAERMLLTLVANGVTTIRNMAGRPWHLVLRERTARGTLIGPRIYTSGPIVSRDSGNMIGVPTVAAAKQVIADQQAAGYDFVKAYNRLPTAVRDTLAAAAKRAGLPLAGHPPGTEDGLQWALRVPFRSLEHLYGYREAVTIANSSAASGSASGSPSAPERIDTARLEALAKATQQAGVWNVPTLSVMRAMGAKAPTVALNGAIVRALQAAGAGLLAGTDAWYCGHHFTGIATHHELQELVSAGLTPFEALETATRNAAAYFGTEAETGTIAPGKEADLVLLDANPLTDIRNTERIAGVMLDGRWLSAADLAARLAKFGASEDERRKCLESPLP